MEAETTANTPSISALTSTTTISGAQETSGGGSLSLRTLDIKHRVPDTNYVRWRVFTSTLDVLPSLQNLSLTGVGFRGADEDEDGAMAATMIVDMSMTSTIIPIVHHNHVPGHGHAVELGQQQHQKDPHLKSRTYPQIQSLSLTFCECPMSTMLDLNRALPQLESLELNKCRNNCLQVFEPEPPHQNNSANNNNGVNNNNTNNNHAHHQPHQYLHPQNHHGRTVPTPPPPAFPNLTQLKIMDRYQGHQVPIYEIIKTRPKLDSLEIQDITLNLESLMVMAGYCAEQGRFLRRFLLAPFWSLSNTRGFERLYEAPFLAKARHLFIQEELTEKILFASTLTTLYIDVGFGGEVIFENECAPVSVWNAVLRRLPNLSVLRIDRYVTDYALFDGLGRSPIPTPLLPEILAADTATSTALPSATSNALKATTSTALDLQGTTREDWSQERPFLQVLQLTFRDSFIVKTIDLDRELVQRFRFLEKLHFGCYRKPDDLDAYNHRWRPGLTVEHRRCLFK
ncbi:hypothetical protein BG011_008474 [Mortierella polycephala]|uniref:F-box domain-containing protein n=1 Tax=Mortierella polycephala TaxID=41804 RepID=A0A9P6Q9I4_9FUNG|nr:hypothetical protein BG011_008474 [Mortierella polycephala]